MRPAWGLAPHGPNRALPQLALGPQVPGTRRAIRRPPSSHPGAPRVRHCEPFPIRRGGPRHRHTRRVWRGQSCGSLLPRLCKQTLTTVLADAARGTACRAWEHHFSLSQGGHSRPRTAMGFCAGARRHGEVRRSVRIAGDVVEPVEGETASGGRQTDKMHVTVRAWSRLAVGEPVGRTLPRPGLPGASALARGGCTPPLAGASGPIRSPTWSREAGRKAWEVDRERVL